MFEFLTNIVIGSFLIGMIVLVWSGIAMIGYAAYKVFHEDN